MSERVYLDHNASSPLRPEAREAVVAALDAANPSSAHTEGRHARRILEEAREELAAVVGCEPDGLVFTSGGTESNAWILSTCADDAWLAVSTVEHPSVLEPATRRGKTVWMDVDPDGSWRRAPADVWSEAPGRIDLVSAMLANHETGALLDVPAVVAAARSLPQPPRVHTDASQALGRIPLDLEALGVDAATLCAHKLGGPIGIGALCLRDARDLVPMIIGGGQEDGRRGGTEAAALAAGFAAAARAAESERDDRATNYISWLEEIEAAISSVDPDVLRNSPTERSRLLPNTLNVSLPGRAASHVVHRFDLEGVAISHGSACASGSLEPSPVLLAVGHDEDRARSSLRISLGHSTTHDDVARFVRVLRRVLPDVAKRNS